MIGVYINSPSMTVEQYRSLGTAVGAAGVQPTGIKLHTCFGEGDRVAIFDVRESEEAFRAFSEAIAPTVAEVGLEPIAPQVVPMIAFEVE